MSQHRVYQLEVTSHCNLACSFCARDKQWSGKDQGFMDMDLLDKIDWGDTEYTELQLSGEPTLHPKLKEIVHHVKSLGIRVGLSTNATKPNVDLSEVDVITNTLDRERSKTLEKEYGKKVFVQELGIDWPYEDTTHEKPISGKDVYDCTTAFNYVSIHWDGDIVPCCKCFGKQHVFGNLYDMSMGQILASKKRTDFLKMFTKKAGKKNYICQYCTTPNPHLIHEKLVRYMKTGSKAGYGKGMKV